MQVVSVYLVKELLGGEVAVLHHIQLLETGKSVDELTCGSMSVTSNTSAVYLLSFVID